MEVINFGQIRIWPVDSACLGLDMRNVGVDLVESIGKRFIFGLETTNNHRAQ